MKEEIIRRSDLQGSDLTEDDDASWKTAVAKAVVEFSYGSTICRRWLEQEFGFDPPEFGTRKEFRKYELQFLGSFVLFQQELLRTHKMALKSMGRGEWTIVRPGEQHELAIEKLREMIGRGLRIANEVISNTNVSMLTMTEARARADAQGRIAAFETMSKRSLSSKEKRMLPSYEGEK